MKVINRLITGSACGQPMKKCDSRVFFFPLVRRWWVEIRSWKWSINGGAVEVSSGGMCHRSGKLANYRGTIVLEHRQTLFDAADSGGNWKFQMMLGFADYDLQ